MLRSLPVPRRRRGALLLALIAVAAAVLAGCGSGSTTHTVTVSAAGDDSVGVPGSAAGVDHQLIAVVKHLSPQVVQVETSSGLGSGIVFDSRGDIVTNAHVVGNSTQFAVTLAGGARHAAKLVGTFPPDDLAVVRLDPVPDDMPGPATFADSAKLQVGQLVLAIGNPLGLRSSVTNGIVSSLGRTVPEGDGAVIASAIQTSAAINPGNSGGALGNLDGAVIGIPTLAATDPDLGGSQAPGIGFAIPSNTVKRIAGQLIADGHVTNSGRAFLGVDIATSATGTGVVVASVEKGGPAADAGIAAGDVIVAVDGQSTPTTDTLSTVLAGLDPGRTVPVAIRHPDGSKETTHVKLGQAPGGE